MLTNANKDTYLVKNWQKYANVIYKRPLARKVSISFYLEQIVRSESYLDPVLDLFWILIKNDQPMIWKYSSTVSQKNNTKGDILNSKIVPQKYCHALDVERGIVVF